ncbi:UNVERIFIED_CONTAM: Methionine S-methyltransferase, partial [Sesamum calycinum]
MEEFLKRCEQSGDAAYAALRSLLERLEDPSTRTDARVFLSELQKRFSSEEASERDRCLETTISKFKTSISNSFEKRKKLSMIVIPSIFMPEDWSFTFYEGLNRHPDSIFKDKRVVELGCGNGWITIAIAEKWSPSKILNPNPDAMSKMITESASEEFLHSLSNYCALQGFVEDQFGLGLIARAIEEGISVIKPLGVMIFNMGGRPGQAVSWAYAKAGGRISHALSVYSCRLRQPNQVKKIFEFLRNGFTDISSSLDLSFEDESVADEKIPFLAHLANILQDISFFSYEPPAGSRRFRSLISGFMRTYHHIPLTADNVVVFPSRTVAIESALRLLSPRLAIDDEQLSRYLPSQWLTTLNIEKAESGKNSEEVIAVIEAPRQSDLMLELIKKLKPEVVVTGIAQFESVTSSAFEHLLDTTKEIGSRLFLDISDHFELSSLPSSNGVLKYLAGTPLPPHAMIVCGLLKNQVYTDLEVAFVISEEEAMFKALCKTVELLQGSTAIISQYYYGCLFHELLSFQLADRRPPPLRNGEKAKATAVNGFSSSTISVLDHTELSINESDESSLVHMDADQSFLPLTKPVKAAIFEKGGTLCFPTGSNGHYVSAAKFLNAKIASIPTNPEVGYKLTEETLTAALKTVNEPWIYISGPTVSPTGLLYSNEEMNKLLSVCAEFGARVILDTSFSGVEFNSKGFNAWNLGATLEKISPAKSTF